MTLVDTNVLIDVLANDPAWRAWSITMLDQRSAAGALIISDVIYAELSPGFAREEQLAAAMDELGVVLQRIPKEALFLAGSTFAQHRSRAVRPSNVLADFFIGAHAQVVGLPILTRDTRRYRTYFPEVQLIAPDTTS